MTHRKLHVDTLILIPTFKIYLFLYSRQTDRQTDGQTEKLIRCGLGNLIACPRFPFMHAAILRFCAFWLFGANDLQTHKNDYASRFAEMKKNAHSEGLVQNLS